MKQSTIPYEEENYTHCKTLETWSNGVRWNNLDTPDFAVIICDVD